MTHGLIQLCVPVCARCCRRGDIIPRPWIRGTFLVYVNQDVVAVAPREQQQQPGPPCVLPRGVITSLPATVRRRDSATIVVRRCLTNAVDAINNVELPVNYSFDAFSCTCTDSRSTAAKVSRNLIYRMIQKISRQVFCHNSMKY